MIEVTATFRVVSPAHAAECVVKAEGEIDLATAPDLREVLSAQLASAPETLIVDMAGVTFIDSTGLSALIDAFKQGQAGTTRVVLRAPSRRVTTVLGVTGLDKVLMVVSDPPHGNSTAAPAVPSPLVAADGNIDIR